jgi:hypothetical protein
MGDRQSTALLKAVVPQKPQESALDEGKDNQSQKPHAEHGHRQHDLDVVAPQAFKNKQRGYDQVAHQKHGDIGRAIVARIKAKRRLADVADIDDLQIASESATFAAARAVSGKAAEDGLADRGFSVH